MMALNRYRLAHLVEQRHPGARRANRLLRRPDRLLGVILLGNNLVNNVAAGLATVIGLRLLGDTGVAVAPIVLTMVFLIFAEIAPKTLAAHFPERIAFPSSYILQPLLRLLYPIVWLLNGLSNLVLKPFHVDTHPGEDQLSAEELRTIVGQGSVISKRRQNMLLGILDLEHVTVTDIMVPRANIVGLDLDDDIDVLIEQMRVSQYRRLPVYKQSINNPIGVFDLINAPRLLTEPEPNKAALLQETTEPYFVPEGTELNRQLFNFQTEGRRVAFVVDEYGDVQGMITRENILEEIVGKISNDAVWSKPEIQPQDDGTHIIEGSLLLREINRVLDWDLPTDGPRTLSGLILEHLEFIPDNNVCLQVGRYRIETLATQDNMVRTARMLEPLPLVVEVDPDDDD